MTSACGRLTAEGNDELGGADRYEGDGRGAIVEDRQLLLQRGAVHAHAHGEPRHVVEGGRGVGPSLPVGEPPPGDEARETAETATGGLAISP